MENIIYLILYFVFLAITLLTVILPFFIKENLINKTISVLSIVLLGVAAYFAYMDAGYSINDSFINAIASFFGAGETLTNVFTKYIRILSPIILLSELFDSIRKSIKLLIYKCIDLFIKESVYVIHGKTLIGNKLYKNSNKLVMLVDDEDEAYYKSFNNHFFAYDTDEKNIDSCMDVLRKEDKTLSNKNVYMFLNNKCGLYYTQSNIHVINLNENIARDFWINNVSTINQIAKNKKYKIEIGIVGNSELATYLLRQAVLYNIYNIKQKFTYKIFTEDNNNINYLKANLNNKEFTDKIEFANIEKDIQKQIRSCDILIVCDDSKLSSYALVASANQKLYFYNSIYTNDENNILSSEPKDSVALTNLQEKEVYGQLDLYLNIETILNDEILKQAKQIHFDYLNQEEKNKYGSPDVCWSKIESSYHRNSSFESAIYNSKIRDVVCDDEKAKPILEHIRWCRFVLLEGFIYAPRTKQETKNFFKKSHSCIVPYNKLPKNEQAKDIRIVKRKSTTNNI